MKILPLHREIVAYLQQRELAREYEKQKTFFERNPSHPDLETELLEPRHLRIWSFRIDRKYRASFVFRDKNTVEIIDVNNHYQ